MRTFAERLRKAFDGFVPPFLAHDAESSRKARLIVAFGFLGGLFGFCYVAFYAAIGHFYGALILLCCSLVGITTPLVLRSTGHLRFVGNFQAMILTIGFFCLASVEGGVHGHAVAWLASVPLCALLLADKRSALIWCGICFVDTFYFCLLDLFKMVLPPAYPLKYHALVTAVGFMAFTVFMSLLGIIFEDGRHRAFKRLDDARVDLARANERLIQLNQEKDEFLGIAAHDLKNRIHNVKGFAELISASLPPEEEQIRSDAGEIIHAAVRMQQAVGNLLALAAIEENRLSLTPQVCDLCMLTHNVIENYRSAAARKKVRIEFPGPAKSAMVVADLDATMQVLDNLLSNAIKYSPFEKTVFVGVTNHAKMCTFSVRDEGQGFTDEDKRFLFNKFTRLSSHPTGGESSTGLGLSIVKKIMEAMGGTVECESKHGQGATFIAAFPTAEDN